jgi:hypothetical protein
MNNAARARPSCLSRSFFSSAASSSCWPRSDPRSIQCSVFSSTRVLSVQRRDVKRGLFRLKVREGPDSSGAAESSDCVLSNEALLHVVWDRGGATLLHLHSGE